MACHGVVVCNERLPDVGQAAHVGIAAQPDGDAAICLLVVLEHGHQGTTHRQTGTIQGVNELRLAPMRAREPACGGAPGKSVQLETEEIRDRCSGPAATLPDRRSWRRRSPCHRWKAPSRDTAAPAVAAPSRRDPPSSRASQDFSGLTVAPSRPCRTGAWMRPRVSRP